MEQESIFIHSEKNVIEVKIGGFGESIDGDKLTSIDYSNLYGEAISISALLNKIGILKAQAEEQCSLKKMEFEIYEAERRKQFRRESAENAGKIKCGEEWIKMTEKALDEAIVLDEAWQIKKKNYIKSQKDLGYVDALYWGIQSKDKKLGTMMKGVTPEELANEIVEGSINTLFIKKHKRLTN